MSKLFVKMKKMQPDSLYASLSAKATDASNNLHYTTKKIKFHFLRDISIICPMRLCLIARNIPAMHHCLTARNIPACFLVN